MNISFKRILLKEEYPCYTEILEKPMKKFQF